MKTKKAKHKLKAVWNWTPYICAILLGLLAFPAGETYGVMTGIYLFFLAFTIIILTSVLQGRSDES